MSKPHNGTPQLLSGEQVPGILDRDRLEIIRFLSDDAQRQARGVLVERGMLNFSSHRLDEWLVRTPIARKLREFGVPFEWLSENA